MENLETSGSALAAGSIAARFISQDTVDEVNAIREKEWKDAYARIGQEPPRQEERVDDGRTLFERLQEQKTLKQEEWDDKMKLSNQYRGLEAEEFKFLSDKVAERRARERKVEADDNAEVLAYREALAHRNASALAAAEPQIATTSSKAEAAPAVPKRVPAKPVKKDIKSLMKGIVVKKKPKSTTSSAVEPKEAEIEGKSATKRQAEDDVERERKRKA